MTQADFFEKLTTEELEEFNNDIKKVCEKLIKESLIPLDKLGELNANMRLGGDKYHLNVILNFTHKDNELQGIVTEIKELSIDEYLDSINNSKISSGKNIKLE